MRILGFVYTDLKKADSRAPDPEIIILIAKHKYRQCEDERQEERNRRGLGIATEDVGGPRAVGRAFDEGVWREGEGWEVGNGEVGDRDRRCWVWVSDLLPLSRLS